MTCMCVVASVLSKMGNEIARSVYLEGGGMSPFSISTPPSSTWVPLLQRSHIGWDTRGETKHI